MTLSADLLEDLRLGRILPEVMHSIPLLEEYKLLRTVGHGAMGRVYLAHDTLLDRAVAIKLLTLQHARGSNRDRFFVEARALAKLSHPNVVTVFRIGDIAGHLFLVSEFVRGQTLEQLRKPLPWQRALELGIGLARGLAAAHRQGVLHRDIKPANAILATDGSVKLVDFGLAKLVLDSARLSVGSAPRHLHPLDPAFSSESIERTQEASWGQPSADVPTDDKEELDGESSDAAGELTKPGARLGTPRYMAPEVFRGETATMPSDVYALGAVLYELCSGSPPHSAASLEALAEQVLSQDAPTLSSVAPGVSTQLSAVVDRCLRRAPGERFLDGEALCLELERLAQRQQRTLPATDSPYRGLFPFEKEHSILFFGRDHESRTVLDRLRERGLVLVTGDSGVGKSSLCRAGVLPRISAGELSPDRRWLQSILVPGRRPLRGLAETLTPILNMSTEALLTELRDQPTETVRRLERFAAARRGLILLVDQVEELITQTTSSEAEAAAAALSRLAEIGPGVRLLLTARADFLTRLVALPRLGEQIERGIYLLPPLSRACLHSAITRPVETTGYRFTSPAMVQELVESTLNTLGGLPLLQFTLSLLWEARDTASRAIPDSALEAIGGVTGALAQYADGVLTAMLPAQRQAARQILPFMVNADHLRLRRSAEELSSITPDAPSTIEALVQARLVVANQQDGQVRYQLAHEALVRGWETLRELLVEDREGRAVRERLLVAAREWQRLSKPVDALWGEPQLAEVNRNHAAASELPELAQGFLAASKRRIRAQQRGRLVRYGLILSLPLITIIFFLQTKRLQQARGAEIEQRRLRESAEVLELGSRAASLAQTPGREVAAMQMAVHLAVPILRQGQVPPATVLMALGAAVNAGRRSMPLRAHTRMIWTTFLSPDGSRVVTASSDETARIWDASTGRPLHTLAGHTKIVRTALFLPPGDRVLTASEDGTARLWNVEDGRLLTTLAPDIGPLSSAYPSPNGRLILFASFKGRVSIWDAARLRPLVTVNGFIGTNRWGNLHSYRAFSPDSQQVALGRSDGGVSILDATTGTLIRALPAPNKASGPQVAYAWYSPDGTRLVVCSSTADGFVLFDPASGRKVATLPGHIHPSLAAFSADSHYLATTGDGTLRLWNAKSGALLTDTIDTKSRVSFLLFSPDGQHLLTTQEDSIVRIWTISGGHLAHELRGHSSVNISADYSADGTRFVTGGLDSTARIWSIQDGLHTLRLQPQLRWVWHATWAPDGRHIALVALEAAPHIFDVTTGQETVSLPGGQIADEGAALAFSPDGSLLAVSNDRRLVRIWDWRARRLVRELDGHHDSVTGITFSGDGERLLTTSVDRSALYWDWRHAQVVTRLAGQTDALWASTLSHDGKRAAVVQYDGRVRVFALPEGRLLFTAESENNRSYSADFSPDGRGLLIGGMQPLVLDASNGALLGELHGHLDVVTSAHFSHDGRTIVTASTDHTIRLWDAGSRRTIHVIPFEDRDFTDVDLSPDGEKILLTSQSQSSVKIFPAQPQAIVEMGCRLLRYQPEWQAVAVDCQDVVQ